MPYILKIKKGDNKGMYVGAKKRWYYTPQEDPNKARVFASIQGIKAFHGTVSNEKLRELLKEEAAKLRIKIYGEERAKLSYFELSLYSDYWSKRGKFQKEYRKLQVQYSIPYTEYYDVIEIKIQI